MTERYALGLDFGTESLRIVLVRTSDGFIAGGAVADYEHGVMDEVFGRTGIGSAC